MARTPVERLIQLLEFRRNGHGPCYLVDRPRGRCVLYVPTFSARYEPAGTGAFNYGTIREAGDLVKVEYLKHEELPSALAQAIRAIERRKTAPVSRITLAEVSVDV